MPPEALPEPWCSFLRELDARCSGEVRLHCIGGFVVTLRYGFARPTSDVDILAVVAKEDRLEKLRESGGQGSALHRKHGIYLDFVGVVTAPENYEERLQEMFRGDLRNLHLFALDAYDLALTKLERNIQRDRDDVRHLARKVPFDLTVLRERYETELRPYLANPERSDLTLKLWLEMIEEDRQG